jgi:hypothetical protein
MNELIQSLCGKVVQTLSSFFDGLNKYDNMSSLMQGVGLALLTILIPFAIAVLTDVLQKKKDKSIEFAELDLHVVLDHVFEVKRLIFFIILVFLPSLLWGISFGIVRLILLLIWIVGVILVGKKVIHLYLWTKGNIFDLRFSYLKKLNDLKDLEIVWRSVWQTDNINILDTKQFFKIFSKKIDRLL